MSSDSWFTWASLTGYVLKGFKKKSYKMRYIFLVPLLCAVKETLGESVVELTSDNFDEGIKKYKAALVMFHAPWCTHCKTLSPDFDHAARELKKSEPLVQLVKVDCAGDGKEICHKLNIRGYPTLKIFRDGKFTKDYKGSRKRLAMIDFMKHEVGPPAKLIDSKESLKKFLDEPRSAVVGYFNTELEEEAKLKKAFLGAAEILKDNVKFGLMPINEMAGRVELIQANFLRNKFEPSVHKYNGKPDPEEIKQWVLKHKNGLVGYRRSSNEEDFKPPIVVAYFNIDYKKNPKGTNYWRNRVLKVAKEFEDDFNFAISSRTEYRQELAQYDMKFFLNDKPVVTARMPDGKKYKMTKEFNMESFKEFLRALKLGLLPEYIKSEDFTDPDGPLLTAVGKNFHKVVTLSKNDTFITFSAPWCDHCKRMAPAWKELATEMENEDVDIIKFNAADNDYPSYFTFDGYPTLFWLPKGKKTKPVRYNGQRTVKDFIKFIAKHTDLKNFNPDGSKKVDEKKKYHSEEL